MPKKCPASYSSTSRKKQRSENKSSNCKKHSRKTAADSCNSGKPIDRHRDVVKGQFPAGPHPKSAPSSCSPKILLEINCKPTSTTDSAPFSCSCSQKRKALGRQCLAVNPTAHCPSHEKTSQFEKSGSFGVGNKCCCGVPRKKENLISVKREKVGPAKDCKPAKEPKPSKSRKERKSRKTIPEERRICKRDGEEAEIFGSADLRVENALARPCNCWKSRTKPSRKRSRNSCSKLLCCSCFKTLWKKKKRKSKDGTAPCMRYSCLHNPGRSETDEAIPCVKCTHNCNAKNAEASAVKELPVGETIVKPCPNPSAKTVASCSKPTKNICAASGPSGPDASENGVVKTKEKCETYEAEGPIPEKRCSAKKGRRKNDGGKSKGENTGKSRKLKPSKDPKKRKNAASCPPKSPTSAAGTSSMEYRCCPCKIPEPEVTLKAKPCMKCPEKMLGGKSSQKKLTFASCADLHDYKLENTDTVKKRGPMGVVFDVIFWPYVFWPRRSDPCK